MFDVIWDAPGEKRYETGLDRGVLYPPGRRPVAWNGLVSVNENQENTQTRSIFFDGVKRFDYLSPGDFSGSIDALTYPDEFVPFDGYAETVGSAGTYLENQPRSSFGLSYRTLVGNDEDGQDYGYKIHILYNLTAEPASQTRNTITSSSQPKLFSWSVKGVPIPTPGYRPTAHIIIDTRRSYPEKIAIIEEILYGNENSAGRLPTIAELEALTMVTVVDNGDGTWTITGPDHYVYPLDGLSNDSTYIVIDEEFNNILDEEGNNIITETEIIHYQLDVFGIEYLSNTTYSIASS